MDAQNLLTTGGIRQVHRHLAVEAAGAQQGGVEHVHSVGGGNDDDIFVGRETVHLHKQGVERLLAFIVTTAHAVATVAPHRINLIDEDKAGVVLLGLGKHVAHAAGTHTHEHFHEVGTGNGVEGHPGLACNSAGQQGLTRAGGAYHEHALGNGAAQVAEYLRVAQELHDFPHFLLGFGDTGHILEGDLVLAGVEQAGTAAGKLHGTAGAAALRAEEEEQEQQHDGEGQHVDEEHAPGVAFHHVFHLVAQQVAHLLTLEGGVELHTHGLKVFELRLGGGGQAVFAHNHALTGAFIDDRAGAGGDDAAFGSHAGEVLSGPDAVALRFLRGCFHAGGSDTETVAEGADFIRIREGHVERCFRVLGYIAVFKCGDDTLRG